MQGENEVAIYGDGPQPASIEAVLGHLLREIGRASCRERV